MTSSNPALVVPDASVLVGWFLSDEECCPGSERLMADFEARRVALLAPPLLKHEIMNTLSLAVKRRRMAREAAVLAWNAFMDLGILFAEPDRFGRSVMALASLPGVSVYDATYVALAETQLHLLYAGQNSSPRYEHIRTVCGWCQNILLSSLSSARVILALALNEPSSYPVTRCASAAA